MGWSLRVWAAVLVLASAGRSSAQSVWDGQGGTGSPNWSTALNWATNTLPGPNQTITFFPAGYAGGALSVLDAGFGSYSAAGLRFNGGSGFSSNFELGAAAGQTLTVAVGTLTSTTGNVVNN
ncbi:MAG TPA: hypothetical protein VMZ71_09670 [Gemmataceae bacterium]|nr:hypothetical protein [Gemmataceae bacterium]